MAGPRTIAGVAGRGETLDVVPRLLITGRRIAGSSFGGVAADGSRSSSIATWRRDRRWFSSSLLVSRARRGQPRLRAERQARTAFERDRVRVSAFRLLGSRFATYGHKTRPQRSGGTDLLPRKHAVSPTSRGLLDPAAAEPKEGCPGVLDASAARRGPSG